MRSSSPSIPRVHSLPLSPAIISPPFPPFPFPQSNTPTTRTHVSIISLHHVTCQNSCQSPPRLAATFLPFLIPPHVSLAPPLHIFSTRSSSSFLSSLHDGFPPPSVPSMLKFLSLPLRPLLYPLFLSPRVFLPSPPLTLRPFLPHPHKQPNHVITPF